MKKFLLPLLPLCIASVAGAATVSDVHSLWIKDIANAGNLNGWANVGGMSIPTDGSSYVSINSGATTTQRFTYDTAINHNIILEVQLAPGAGITTPAAQSTFLALGSDTNFRRVNNTSNVQATIWGAGGSANQTFNAINTYEGAHFAIVYDYTNSLVTWFVDKQQVWSTTLAPSDGTAKVGVGGDVHPSSNARGAGIAIEGLSYATFTGTFNPTTDFQLSQVPEPSTYALFGAGLSLGAVALIRRRKQK